MTSNIDFAKSYGLNLLQGTRLGVSRLTMTGNLIIAVGGPSAYFLDANGVNRDVTLPETSEQDGVFLYITNIGSVGDLHVKDSGGVAIVTLAPDTAGFLVGSGANWSAITAGAGGVGSPGGASGTVQYNNGGLFGGLTDTQLTARINTFTAALSGAVPPPTVAAGKFLRDDATWQTIVAVPAGANTQVQFNNAGVLGADPDFAWTGGNTLALGSGVVLSWNLGEATVTHGTIGIPALLFAGAALRINNGGDSNIYITKSSNILTRNLVSLNGSFNTTTAAGIHGGTTGDANLYYNVPTGGRHQFDVNGTEVARINGSGVLTLANYGMGQLATNASGVVSAVDDELSISFIFDGGGAAITTGIKGDLEIPFACIIQQATLLADQAGSVVIDIWKDTFANFPPTVADTITAAAKPTLSTANKSQDATLTGWTTAIAAGDILRFNVDSASTVTRVILALKVKKSY